MQAFEEIPLRTDRLVLRPLGEADVDQLFLVYSDPKVMRYWSTPIWSDRAPANAMIARDKAQLGKENLRLGIETLIDGRLVGTCALFGINSTCRRAEIGYALASAAWNRGYMHEALTALLDYAFRNLNLNRLEADIDPRNEPSAKALERLGFVKEGYLRERWIVGDEVSDTALYGLLQSDWSKKQS